MCQSTGHWFTVLFEVCLWQASEESRHGRSWWNDWLDRWLERHQWARTRWGITDESINEGPSLVGHSSFAHIQVALPTRASKNVGWPSEELWGNVRECPSPCSHIPACLAFIFFLLSHWEPSRRRCNVSLCVSIKQPCTDGIHGELRPLFWPPRLICKWFLWAINMPQTLPHQRGTDLHRFKLCWAPVPVLHTQHHSQWA